MPEPLYRIVYCSNDGTLFYGHRRRTWEGTLVALRELRKHGDLHRVDQVIRADA
jgi:hypothetical protein